MRSLVTSISGVLLALGASCGSKSIAPGDGGETCAQLVSDYQAAVAAARPCTPGAPNQCQSAVPVFLNAGCVSYVNDGTQALAIADQWFNQCCHESDAAECSLMPCPQTGPWSCVVNDAGAPGGLCSLSPPATTN